MSRDSLAARLLATFLGEMEEQLRVMSAELLALEGGATNPGRVQSLFRVFHTLKGAAHAAGVPLVEETCHALETLLARVRDGKAPLTEEEIALLFSAVDALTDAAARITDGGTLAGSPLAALNRRLRGPAAPAAPRRPAPPKQSAPAEHRPTAPAPAADRHGEHVRVPAEKLDALLASAGQLLVASGRATARPEELTELHDFVTRWASEWRRQGRHLRVALERAGVQDPALGLVTRVEEELSHVLQETGRIATGARNDARALARVSEEVAERVRRLRMRPFADACEALPRVVRDVAAAAGKSARLEVSGGEVEADRAVIDGLREAILHLVRNAVDHGIEPPGARERAGKPQVGRVVVSAALRGDRIVITVADDGAGLDVAAVREQLARRGLPVPTHPRELVRALFEVGFSTRTEVTAISGRGVGLDIAREAVARIRGVVEANWEEGRGTTFVLDCPLTLATVRVLLARVG
ncbi:MAG TPA: ATP-binding protein, partial [Longimicrobiaceae bacterium]|nr:ATP-binding protein [Longimicrobiaceae bacterium]